MPFLELEHSLLHYSDHGEGSPLVFVHGACENSSFWKEQIAELEKRYQLILLDLPGHGQSAKSGDEVSVDFYARVVTEAIQGLELELPTLVGHSMGGGISMTAAVAEPELLGGLVLANTGAKLGVLPEILAGLETDFAETIRSLIAPREVGREHADQILEWIANEMVLTDSKVGLEDFLACSQFDLRSRLKVIRTPTLILSGDRDQLTPPKWAVYLNENIKDSELSMIQGTGHLPMLERPEVFNQVLTEFASRLAI